VASLLGALFLPGLASGEDKLPKEIRFRTKYFPYEGDLERVTAIPRIVVIRNERSEYLQILLDVVKIDLKPLLKEGVLVVFTESETVKRAEEQRSGDGEIWIFTESQREPVIGLEPAPPKKQLGVAILPQSDKPLYTVRKTRVEE
jgi:hypothetical protein